MPRRPLSAYNFFFSEERERVLAAIPDPDGTTPAQKKEEADAAAAALEKKGQSTAETERKASETAARLLNIRDAKNIKRRPHRKSHGKIAFKDLARLIGKRWRALKDDEKVKYNELAEKDLQRYNEQMKEYNSKKNRYNASYQTTPGPLPPQLNTAVAATAQMMVPQQQQHPHMHHQPHMTVIGGPSPIPMQHQAPAPPQALPENAPPHAHHVSHGINNMAPHGVAPGTHPASMAMDMHPGGVMAGQPPPAHAYHGANMMPVSHNTGGENAMGMAAGHGAPAGAVGVDPNPASGDDGVTTGMGGDGDMPAPPDEAKPHTDEGGDRIETEI